LCHDRSVYLLDGFHFRVSPWLLRRQADAEVEADR
jgi:hypothetical protein